MINNTRRTNNDLNIKNNNDKNEQNDSRKRISFELEEERSVRSDSSDTDHRNKRYNNYTATIMSERADVEMESIITNVFREWMETLIMTF